MNNILVCGGAGYVGSMTAKLLKKSGYNPIVVDDLRSGHEFLVKFGPFEKLDIINIKELNRVFKQYNPIAVMHFAAVPSVPEANMNAWECYNNNITATNNLIKVMLDNNVKNLVFSSTAALFGNAGNGVIDENTKIEPVSTYGKSKAIMENILDDYGIQYNFNTASLRYFNVSGCDPELEVGECHIIETHIIPVMLEMAAKGKEFTIFGDDYDTKDGSCVRDYIHVYDIAVAHILALEKLLSSNKSFKVNLGNGNGFSVKEMVTIAKEVTGIDFKVKIGERRQGDPASIATKNTLAKQILNWEPIYKDPKTHILHAWQWYKKYHNIA
ncbi:UDP-glucose 4-epimerase GalE [Rickettsiales bacterium LUAb2]